MFDTSLARAVELFALVTQNASESDLERAWVWGAYEEGVRFSFFRTYEELRELAVRIAAERKALGTPLSSAQHTLAQYHQAFRELEAALIGLTEQDVTRTPPEDEWSILDAYRHIARSDSGFYILTRFALNHYRDTDGPAVELPDDVRELVTGVSEAAFEKIMERPYPELHGYHRTLHESALQEFSGITGEELEAPSLYWEGYPLPIRFRLHRFDSHLRQHTIQIDKTRLAIGKAPSEAQRLLRIIYQVLGEAEGQAIGAMQVGEEASRETAQAIMERCGEIDAILKG